MHLSALLSLILLTGQSQPASGPVGPGELQPGVWIDWQQREVQVQARVVLRSGPLEFLACWPGKEHESILRFEAAPEAVYMALGLLGLEPGHPVRWNADTESFDPPAGDLVEISLAWMADDGRHIAEACDWLREIEYGRAALSRPWVFTGSLRRDEARLSCGLSGVGVALVDFPDSLLCHTRRHPSRFGELWAEAHTERIPPANAVVRMILRPARPRRHSVVLDQRGAVWLDSRYCSVSDLVDMIDIARRLDADHVQTISVAGALLSDQEDLRRALARDGIPSDRLLFETGLSAR